MPRRLQDFSSGGRASYHDDLLGMRSWSYIAVVAAIVAMLVFAGGVYAYDSARAERVADGVTVAGIALGGLDRAAARAKLERELLEPLSRPVVARHKQRKFRLTSEDARLRVDLDASVDAAIRASRDGNPLTRTVRDVTGGEVDEDVEVRVDYSRKSVDRLVRRVRDALDRDAVDASIDLANGSLDPVPERDGRRVKSKRLERDVVSRLSNPVGKRSVRIRTAVVEPEVRRKDLASKYPTVIRVDRGSFMLTLYKNLKVAKTYSIAVGKAGSDTPAGLYNIQNKAVNPSWHVPNSDWAGELAGRVIPPGPENPIKSRWMGIYDGAGIHGTDADYSIGSAASQGCIRMRIPDVIDLYERVETGDPVYIA
jgi:lipoprotein-anchoring transpeptidase ErfK/SrfK